MIDEKRVLEAIASFKRCQKSENCNYLTGYISALSAVEGMIAEQPKVGDWIPVSKRLPEKYGRYLVYSETVIWVANFFNDAWWGIERKCRWGDVQAWMPLPETYKEEVTE